MIQVVDGAMTAGYTYNGNGQRVKKTVNGVTTVFHYNLAGQLIAEANSTGATTAEYVYLNSQPLAKIEGSNVYFYHNDHLATPQKMTDSTGSVVWSADYKPFGETTVTVSTITNNLRFPGQYFDAETGLNYNYFRDYNPVIGRYVQADPIGFEGGINLYAFVENNPFNFTDPFGLTPSCGKKDPCKGLKGLVKKAKGKAKAAAAIALLICELVTGESGPKPPPGPPPTPPKRSAPKDPKPPKAPPDE